MIPNPHIKHPSEYLASTSISQKLAGKIEPMFGSMKAFYLLLVWYATWITLSVFQVGLLKKDPYPFTFLLFLGNIYQLVALPILGYLTKQADKKRDAKANADHQSLTYIASLLEQLVADEQNQNIEVSEETMTRISRIQL